MLGAFQLGVVAAFVGVSGLVGTSLLRLARRTGGLPELTMGLSFLLGACVGYAAMVASEIAAPALGEHASVLSGAGELCVSIGCTSLYVFAWQTFRPQHAWAGALFAVGTAAALGGPILETMLTGMSRERTQVWYYIAMAGRTGPYLWSFVESVLYHRLLRRRRRLGLAARSEVQRQLLWAGAFGTAAVIFIGAVVQQTLQLRGVEAEAAFDLAYSTLGLASAACTWKAFYGGPRPGRRAPAATPVSDA